MTASVRLKEDNMINAIGEATMQQIVRSNYNAEIFDKDREMQKSDKVKKQRPIEESDDGQKAQMNPEPYGENMRTRNSFEDGKIVVEKYDEDGKLVKKTPPGYLPLGERV
jgi:hypothetical protein